MVLAVNNELKTADDEMMEVDISKDELAHSMHDELVAYVNAISGDPIGRSGVWVEHSYARADRGRLVRTLLAPPPPAASSFIDVDTVPVEPELPASLLPEDQMEEYSDWPEVEDCEEDSVWEERVRSLAPSTKHWELAAACAAALRAARLAALAGGGRPAARRLAVESAARTLRLALAPHWAAPGPPQSRPGAWMVGALTAYLPPSLRLLLPPVLTELRRCIGGLADRLMPPPTLALSGAPADNKSSEDDEDQDLATWNESPARLIWVCGSRTDQRWRKVLRPLIPLLKLKTGTFAPARPDIYVGAQLSAARAQLADIVDERGVILAGSGVGAAMCMALAAGDGGVLIKALVLLNPPLDTPDGPNDAINEISVPMLIICGSQSAMCTRSAACEAVLSRRAGGGTRGGGRVVCVSAADGALRLDLRTQARLHVTQHALDHKIADEIIRFISEVKEEPASNSSEDYYNIEVPMEPEYSHLVALPPATSTQSAVLNTPINTHRISGTRTLEIIEGRVVSRAASTPQPALAPNDILQMPIVFADDEQMTDKPETPVKEGALTVTSGNPRLLSQSSGPVKYTRVIVAKRGGDSARERGLRSGGVGRSSGQPHVGGARPLVVRRSALTLVPRKRDH